MTMFLNAVYPYIDLGISFGTLALFRCLDQGFSSYLCCKKEKTTKCKTIQAYVNIYSGPEHVMSYKYSAILTTVCVTFWYGVALPELFPIAAFTFFNYYVVDRFLITYYYRRPPIYDDKLNRAALGFMQAGPVMLMLFGYWCMGNMQIFTDNVHPLTNASVPLTTDHNVYPSSSTNQALPMFIVGLVLLFGLLFWDFIKPLFSKLGLAEDDEDIIVDEKVGSFYECVSVADRKRWYAEELHAVKDLGISSMGKGSVDRMRSAVGGWRVIKNAPNYEILSNIKFCQAFQFSPIDMCNTAEEQAVSETIMKVLYMGYARPGHQDFDFKKALHTRSHKRAAHKMAKAKAMQMMQANKAKAQNETIEVDL